MGIRLDISVSTPLSEEDDKVLAGLAYMTMALANRNAEPEESAKSGCGQQDPSNPTAYCVEEPDHSGRHTYRDFGDGEAN